MEISRPQPPAELSHPERPGSRFAPAPELLDWVTINFLSGGPLHNEEHAHLEDAELAFLFICRKYVHSSTTRPLGSRQTPYSPCGPLRISLLPPFFTQKTDAGFASAQAPAGQMVKAARTIIMDRM